MGNLKKFLSNKNIVTLLGAILVVIVLYLFYRWRVNAATQPVSIPYAMKAIETYSQVTVEDVALVEIPQSSLQGNVISNASDVYNKCTTSFIPAGGFFYASSKTDKGGNVINCDDVQNSYLYNKEPGDIAFNYKVNVKTTYGNSFFPGQYFDIYLKVYKDKEKNKIAFGKFVNNVKILAVRDGAGRDVLATTEEIRTPDQIVFGVNDEINAYLRVAEKLENVEIILVPTDAARKYENSTVPAAAMVNGALQEYLDPYVNYVKTDVTVPNEGNTTTVDEE